MNTDILRGVYRYREEMIMKLSEFFINSQKYMTNFHISDCLLQIISLIHKNEKNLKKKEA